MEAYELALKISATPYWIEEDCRALCKAVGMEEAFNAADGETFETVMFAALDKAVLEHGKQ